MTRKFLIAQSLIYWVGRVVSRSVSLLLLPLYTAFIAPSEWGILSILFVTGDLLGIIAIFQIPSALYRFWSLTVDEGQRRRLCGTALLVPLLVSTAMFLPGYLASSWVARVMGVGDQELLVRVMLFTQQLTIIVQKCTF